VADVAVDLDDRAGPVAPVAKAAATAGSFFTEAKAVVMRF
jgi:hypothetical protein